MAPLGLSFHPPGAKAGVSWANVVNLGPKNNPLETPPSFIFNGTTFKE